ncbi:overexpressed in colon carcinoma 1 protein homolog [Triplophysa dalaica]|uniref:overexpressed in colon carcinoma 1 protein homolog n=1 Tax=Triplophysa dalaica TaxID=1582913 RepID=UPI0024DFE7A4|nr:overexpressed in colon carcinoma 1 protein homolog [Triplophysa dalaica]
MGCGNSTPTITAAGPAESVKDIQDDSSGDAEKRQNYGGVYVGIPADLSNVAPGQIPSTLKGEIKTLPGFAYYYHL